MYKLNLFLKKLDINKYDKHLIYFTKKLYIYI